MFDKPPAQDTALHIQASRLRAICRQLKPAFMRRSPTPVLGTALVTSGPDGTSFTLTDCDLQIEVQAGDLTSAGPWQACIPFGLLSRLARTLDGLLAITFTKGGPHPAGTMDQLTLATDDGLSATINLLCLPADFPALPADLDDPARWQTIDLTPADLRRLLMLTAPCVSTEETRYYLNGVHLCQKPGAETLRTVASDGHRMAVVDTAARAPESLNCIVPTVAVRAMLALVSHKANDPVVWHIAHGSPSPRMRLMHGPIRIDCKLIDGRFPDYTRVIPTAAPKASVTLTASAMRRLQAIMTGHVSVVKFADGKATIRTPDLEGEISLPAPMTMVDGADPFEIGFNLRYILAQGRMTATFRMDLSRPSDPALIRSEDPDAMWVIMPMRV